MKRNLKIHIYAYIFVYKIYVCMNHFAVYLKLILL